MTTAEPARRAVRILVVDDNEDHLELAGRRLRDAGFTVDLVGTGAAALAGLDGVDLVLLDYRLPDTTGLDVLARIREMDGPAVVIVTGMGSEGTAVRALRSGAIDYVVKEPGYLAGLPQVVERAWKHDDLARRARELQRLALLVTSATERAELLPEIVRGARRLFRARAAMLFIGDDGLSPEASDPDEAGVGEAFTQDVASLLSDPTSGEALVRRDQLLVLVRTADGERLGVLAVVGPGARGTFDPEEIRLGETFASYAGIALEKLHRLELERALVEELQQMLELRRAVVASVSHELRTPLTCIRGFSATLRTRWEEIADADRLLMVDKVERHAEDLSQLVESLLDFASVEAGRLRTQVRELDLKEELKATAADLAPLLAGRDLRTSVPGIRVLADAGLLRRIVSNLISNAVKYSESPAPIVVRAVVEDATVRIEVVDQGIGLSSAEAGRVFEPFWRARQVAAQAMRGAGIGLALVREYVRVLGGTVGVDSEPGVGSTFWFTLPLAGVLEVGQSERSERSRQPA